MVVAHVVPSSSAERAGIFALDVEAGRLGDVIPEVNGDPVGSVADLALDRAGLGARITLTVVRDEHERHVEIEIIDTS